MHSPGRSGCPRIPLGWTSRPWHDWILRAPDLTRFPALRLARDALRAGGGAPTILNAANEIAVEAFLARRCGFLAIAGIVEAVLGRMGDTAVHGLDDVMALDAMARRIASEMLAAHSARPAA